MIFTLLGLFCRAACCRRGQCSRRCCRRPGMRRTPTCFCYWLRGCYRYNPTHPCHAKVKAWCGLGRGGRMHDSVRIRSGPQTGGELQVHSSLDRNSTVRAETEANLIQRWLLVQASANASEKKGVKKGSKKASAAGEQASRAIEALAYAGEGQRAAAVVEQMQATGGSDTMWLAV